MSSEHAEVSGPDQVTDVSGGRADPVAPGPLPPIAAWLGGALLGVVLVAGVGLLSLRIRAAEAGAQIDLDNQLVSVASPTLPVLPLLAVPVLGALVLAVVLLVPRGGRAGVRTGLPLGFAAASAALVVWAYASRPDAQTVVEARTTGSADGVTALGVLPGWPGWLQEGGQHPTVHLLVVLALGALPLLLARGRARARRGLP